MITSKLDEEEAIFDHNIAMVIINKSFEERTAYDAARYAWRVNPEIIGQADYILAVAYGEIIGVFIADQWKSATLENFPEYPDVAAEGRFGFIGRDAPKEIVQRYLFKRIPIEYRRKGMAAPIRYNYDYNIGEKTITRKIFVDDVRANS